MNTPDEEIFLWRRNLKWNNRKSEGKEIYEEENQLERLKARQTKKPKS